MDPRIERLQRRMNDLSDALPNDGWASDVTQRAARGLLDELLAFLGSERADAAAAQPKRESEFEYGSIMDNIPHLVSVLTATGAPEFINRQIFDFTGKTADELKHWSVTDLIHPGDRALAVQCFESGIPAGDPFELTYRMRNSEGEYRWVHSLHRPLREPGGRIVRWYVSVNDIDDRKRAEEALQSSANNLRLIINTIPALAWSAHADGSIEFLNQHYLNYVGITPDRVLDWDWASAIHPEDLAGLSDTWRRITSSGAAGEAEARLRGSDGEYRWFLFRASPLRDAQGCITKWYGVNTDIAERKRAEEALRVSELNLLKIINTLPTTAWSTRADGYCDFLSHRWLDYAGFTSEQAAGWGWGAVIHPDDAPALVGHWQACLATGTPVDTEARMRRHDGVYRWFLFRANPLRDESGTIVKWYGTNIDIEDRKRAEATLSELRSELTHMSRISSLGVLTASVTHEMSQPLAGIITNANTCLRMLATSPPNITGALETARRTIRDGTRASEVVVRLRALSSKNTANSEAVDLNEATADVIALAKSDLLKNRVTLRLELGQELPRLTADRVQLQQVILHLLLNAADALSSVHDRPRLVVIRTSVDGDEVRWSVQDVGVGFATDEAERLFQAFYTTKASGMGIGLSVSRSIIESLNGRLWGEPNDGPGATFSFAIPRRESDGRAG